MTRNTFTGTPALMQHGKLPAVQEGRLDMTEDTAQLLEDKTVQEPGDEEGGIGRKPARAGVETGSHGGAFCLIYFRRSLLLLMKQCIPVLLIHSSASVQRRQSITVFSTGLQEI